MTETVRDARADHWVYRAPKGWRPYLQLARYDRPVGYWLLALPGWIGLAFASLSHNLVWLDLKWAALIFMGAVAMRGAGCTYNDIVDRDLDAQVARTALRPVPAGTVTLKQAWMWLLIQCFVGLLVLLALPDFAQIVALCSIPLVAAYPFMKRITWWPQVWLGLTFNWAVLVAYAIKTGTFGPAVGVLYIGLMFWTVGYDTIYACQDVEDDALVGIKSTARLFGLRIRRGICISYFLSVAFITFAVTQSGRYHNSPCGEHIFNHWTWGELLNFHRAYIETIWYLAFSVSLFALHLFFQIYLFSGMKTGRNLALFKSNKWAGLSLVVTLYLCAVFIPALEEDPAPCQYTNTGRLELLNENEYTPITSK
ncbi:MAG: 4-hydroxybenzoate octaprenyltransferase [Hyphomonadaceae bacterium]|nr:4-hydroxybenzoate octaprenyltransferase [Hyphomonadaceae bacterium]MBC6411827.1 4-hydroxybenzoate octaprenyltransferase [Hyphomonadaceae bacterium]